MTASMVVAGALLLSLASGLSQEARPALAILHQPLDCIVASEHPVVDAVLPAGLDVRSVKVYFRSDKYPKFYFVEMARQQDRFRTLLPRPSSETERIIYYLEAVDVTFNNVIGSEHAAEVRASCPDRDLEDPRAPAPPAEIVVGATEPGAAPFPPGFETLGIIGTITSAGVLSGLGGGPGIGTAIAVGGVAAGVGGAVVVAQAPSDPTTSEPEPSPTPRGADPPSPPEPETTPPPPPSPPPPSAPTPPPEPPEPPPEPTDPPPPPPPSPPPPTPTPTSPLTACFEASFPGGSCNLKLDGRCSSGSVVSYEWVIDADAKWGGVSTHSGERVNRNFPLCSGEKVVVSLTVAAATGEADTAVETISLPMSLEQNVPPLRSSFTSILWTSAGDTARGSVLVNGARLDGTDDSGPRRHEVRSRGETVEIEAFLTSVSRGGGFWKFEFTRAAGFVGGSIQSERGQLVSVGDRHIVFRLDGAPGERLKFRYRLAR